VLSIDWDGSEAGLKFSKEAMETLAREAGSASGVASKCTQFCAWPGQAIPAVLARAEHRL
jgi:hypothetical protein